MTFPAAQLLQVYDRARKTRHYDLPEIEQMNERVWSKIPLTEKSDLRAAYPFGFLACEMTELSSYHESSGTTGQVISSYFTASDFADVTERFLRSRADIRANDMVLIKTPYSMVTTAHQMHAAAVRRGATVVPADNRSGNMPYTRVLRLLRDLPVTVTWSLPTEILIWAYLAKHAGLNPATDFPHLRRLMVAGESLSAAKRARLSEIWGGKAVIEDYGSTETGSLAGECTHGHLHLWTDRVYCEVLEGALVVTPLFREAMPLVRYNLEDQVRVGLQNCACGSVLPTVEILGRQSSKIAGFFPRDLEQLIYSEAEQMWFWRSRLVDGRMEVEIHAGAKVDTIRLADKIEFDLGVPAKVTECAVESFVPNEWLANEKVMQKPRYVFTGSEDWQRPLAYA